MREPACAIPRRKGASDAWMRICRSATAMYSTVCEAPGYVYFVREPALLGSTLHAS